MTLAKKSIWPVAALFSLVPLAGIASEGPFGLWFTEKGKVAVHLTPCGDTEGTLCGQIAWLKKPYTKSGVLKRDTRNDQPDLRDRPWCGLTVITDLTEREPGVWTGGTFYYPKDGRRYDIEVREGEESGLTVYAFLGIKLLGKMETWRRVESELPGCPID
ncbi:MAG: DUF2147 domain-containing protein [Pseudomonadota bacterium]